VKKINVVIFGHGSLCVWLAKYILKSEKYKLILIIVTKHESLFDFSLKRWCIDNKISYTQNLKKILKYKDLDLGISVYYDKIIEGKIINKFKIIINLHNSLLPTFRGVNPVNWAFKLNKPIGITLHKINKEIDSGEIYYRKKIFSKKTIFENNIECMKKTIIIFKKFLKKYPSINGKNINSIKKYFSKKDSIKLGKYKYSNQKKSLYKIYGNYIFKKTKKKKSLLMIFNNDLPKKFAVVYKTYRNILILSDKKIQSTKNFLILDNIKKFEPVYKKLLLNKVYFNKIYIQQNLLKKFNLSKFKKFIN
jgi:folate-dependent phosphoribosylglycinamide formyltransferase PurN